MCRKSARRLLTGVAVSRNISLGRTEPSSMFEQTPVARAVVLPVVAGAGPSAEAASAVRGVVASAAAVPEMVGLIDDHRVG